MTFDSPAQEPRLGAGLGVLVVPLCLLLCGCASTQAQQREDQPVVEALDIRGTAQLSESELRSKILTSETSAFDWLPFVPEQRFDALAWQADLRRIERFYESEGFYDARIVSEEVKPLDGGDGVALTVTLSEGEPTRVTSLRIEGLDELPPEHQRKVLDDFPIQEGEVFREAEWEGVKETLRLRLHELGYADGAVQGTVEVDVATREAKVELRAVPGQRYKFGNIFVATGPRSQVRPQWVIEQAQQAITPGEWFSESALSNAQARVFAMGVFGAVKVNRGAPDRAKGTVPVVVDVREAPFRTVRAGGGVGLDPSRYESRLLAEYTHRNFLGGLRRLNLRSRAGYAYIRSAGIDKAGPFAELTGEFEQPRFLWPTLTGRVRTELERGLEPAYDYYGGRLQTGVVWRPFPRLSVFPSYNLEAYRLTGQVTLGGRSPELIFGCSGSPCVLALSYMEQLIEYDARDDQLEPRNGYYLNLSIQEGGRFLGGDFDYLRLAPEGRYYTSFGDDDRFTLAFRLKLGTLLPRRTEAGLRRDSDSPIVARFYSGGGSWMRGFSNRRLSPMQAVEARDPYEEDGLGAPLGKKRGATVPIGGNGLVESSVEARYNVVGDLVLATFFDSGLVTPGSLYLTEWDYFRNNLLHAVGVGVRYRTLLGPIRLDVAYRLPVGPPLRVIQPPKPQPEYDIQSSSGCFGLGGKRTRDEAGAPEGPCVLHLSIGEAF